LNKKRMIRIARLILTATAALTMTGYAEARNGSNKIVLVSPAELPELARVTGQAMMLHAKGGWQNSSLCRTEQWHPVGHL